MTHASAPAAQQPAARHRRAIQRWLRTWLTGLGLAGSGLSWAQTDAGSSADPLTVLPAQVRLGVEKLRLPGDESMGLVGTSYLVEIGHGLSVGPAAYGAISGRRGGLFTIGAEAAWHRRLVGPLALDVGFYAGGGGGGAAPVGGGLMLRPHADLTWDFGPYRAGVSLSQVRFANGQIDSRQLGLVWSTATDFRYVAPERIGAPSSISGRSGMGFDRVQAVFGVYRPRSGSLRNSGGPMPSSIGFVGTRMERAVDDHAYWGLEAAGAASGGVAGYAEYLATIGTETTPWRDLTVGARVAIGMGGGGDVSVGGGLLLKGGLYGTVRLTRDLGLSLEAGVTAAPQGSFKALHAAASLNWILDDPSDVTAPERTTRTEWVGGVERYSAARRDGSTRELQAVTLKVNRFVASHVYLSGQAHSAYGGQAGGYTVGLFGLGVQAPLGSRWRAGAEALIGAAGGGGVDTQGGAIAQPMAYVGVDITPALSLRVGGGRIKSLKKGGLSAGVLDVALAFSFGVAGHGYR
jgi:hypothetical protein